MEGAEPLKLKFKPDPIQPTTKPAHLSLARTLSPATLQPRAAYRQNSLGVWIENIAWIAPRIFLPFFYKFGGLLGVFLDELIKFWNSGLEPYFGVAPWAGKVGLLGLLGLLGLGTSFAR